MRKLIFAALGGLALRWIQKRMRRQPAPRARGY